LKIDSRKYGMAISVWMSSYIGVITPLQELSLAIFFSRDDVGDNSNIGGNGHISMDEQLYWGNYAIAGAITCDLFLQR
jgi:hypothetical protein